MTNRKAFTIIELITVITIITILILITLPNIKTLYEISDWTDERNVIEPFFNYAISHSDNSTYIGVRFYDVNNEQYMQVVQSNPNIYYQDDPNILVLIPHQGFQKHKISKQSRVYFSIQVGKEYFIHKSMKTFYYMFYNHQLRQSGVYFNGDGFVSISLNNITLKNQDNYIPYFINRYTGQFINIKENSLNINIIE